MENKQEISEDNKLIAHFMGYIKCDRCNGCIMLKLGDEYILKSSLKYDTSWDFIMPVLGKIKNINNIEGLTKATTKLLLALSEVDIEILYKEIIIFIKWYNQQ